MDRISNDSTKKQPLSRRERKREEARLGILDAAARVFHERGFAGAGMRDIAAAADLSPANIYYYFRSKDEILYFCQDRTLDRMLEALESVRSMRAPVPDRMHHLAVAHVLYLIDDVEGVVAHFEFDVATPRLRQAIQVKRDQYKQGIMSLIALGIRRGEFRKCNVKVAMRAFLGALNWTPRWYEPGGPESADEVASGVADYAVAGLVNCSSEKTSERTEPRRIAVL